MLNGLGRKKTGKKPTSKPDPSNGGSSSLNTGLDPSDHGTSQLDDPSHISRSRYNKRCRELLMLDRDLRALGASMFFNLPCISVIGSQSAGKSSLVEAVSGINVPRDSGTCTRCPMECTMTQAETWSCDISLRLKFDVNGNPYPALQAKPFGPTLTNKADVEIWLRRAQAAILSPYVDASQFHDKSKDDLEHLRQTDNRVQQFSKNMIHVDVRDPDVVGLSFIDLPGLIQNSDAPELIDLVKDLVVSNINEDNTLILIATPMSDDLENQQAVRLAKEADPAGERTIGVLAKPDVVLPSSIGQLHKWRDVLEGNTYQLQHGYYCVRLPDEAERLKRLSRSESEKQAEGFFNTRAPWNTMSLRSRFGIPNLVTDISALLVLWIEKNLPNLRKQLNDLIEKCNKEISELPPILRSEPSTEILLRLGTFCRAFHDAVCATGEKGLARQARERYRAYKTDILRTSPDFRPFTCHQRYCRPNELEDHQDTPDSYCTPPMDLEYVRRVIKNSTGWELPGHVPYAATTALVSISTDLWRTHSISCFGDVYEATNQTIVGLIHEHFGPFPKAERYIRSLVNTELVQSKLHAQQSVDKLLQSESRPLYTQNTVYFETEQKKWHRHYSNANKNARSYWLPSSPPRPPISGDDTDAFSEELLLMSRVHAYFRVAYKRIIDRLPLIIECSLNRALDSTLYEKLLEKVTTEPNYASRMVELVEENQEVAVKRHTLSEKQQRLLQIQACLDRLENL